MVQLATESCIMKTACHFPTKNYIYAVEYVLIDMWLRKLWVALLPEARQRFQKGAYNIFLSIFNIIAKIGGKGM